MAERPADLWDLQLKLSAEMESGDFISRSVRIHGPSGEIQPIDSGAGSNGFNDKLAELSQ